jgi:DNA-binding transcriptional MerR regulator
MRTVRYYEEFGLVAPSKRTTGGFRLYNEADVERLELIKQMKPLGFSLEEMRELLDLLDELAQASSVELAKDPLLLLGGWHPFFMSVPPQAPGKPGHARRDAEGAIGPVSSSTTAVHKEVPERQ